MKAFLTVSLLLFYNSLFSQDSGLSGFANLLGNGTGYSLGIDYELPIDFMIRPGIQIGGSYGAAFTNDGTYSIPMRGNLHIGKNERYAFILGGGLALTDGTNRTEDHTQTNKTVGFGSLLYHRNMKDPDRLYYRVGVDVTEFTSADVSIAIPIPNATLGYKF